jgi:hypothetical protein
MIHLQSPVPSAAPATNARGESPRRSEAAAKRGRCSQPAARGAEHALASRGDTDWRLPIPARRAHRAPDDRGEADARRAAAVPDCECVALRIDPARGRPHRDRVATPSTATRAPPAFWLAADMSSEPARPRPRARPQPAQSASRRARQAQLFEARRRSDMAPIGADASAVLPVGSKRPREDELAWRAPFSPQTVHSVSLGWRSAARPRRSAAQSMSALPLARPMWRAVRSRTHVDADPVRTRCSCRSCCTCAGALDHHVELINCSSLAENLRR